MTDPNYYQRRRDIRDAVARGDFYLVSRALYKVLIYALEIDDPHVISYAWAKRALIILAKGPKYDPRLRHFNADGSITLRAADKCCNYVTTAMCLMYAAYQITKDSSEDVLKIRKGLVRIFGTNATSAHIRCVCFKRLFKVSAKNVIRWRGKLFSDICLLCPPRGDEKWEVDLVYDLMRALKNPPKKRSRAIYSSSKKNNSIVRNLNRTVHENRTTEEIKVLLLEMRTEFRIEITALRCECDRLHKDNVKLCKKNDELHEAIKRERQEHRKTRQIFRGGGVERPEEDRRTPDERKIIGEVVDKIDKAKKDGVKKPSVKGFSDAVFRKWRAKGLKLPFATPEKLREAVRYDLTTYYNR